MSTEAAGLTTFAEFWTAYDRKVAKRDAEKAWSQALKRGISPKQIMASLSIMKVTEWKGRKREYIPYPASFLRGESFTPDNRESYEMTEGPESVPEYSFVKPPPHTHHCELHNHDWLCPMYPGCMFAPVELCPRGQLGLPVEVKVLAAK